jgi:hypothetical protein
MRLHRVTNKTNRFRTFLLDKADAFFEVERKSISGRAIDRLYSKYCSASKNYFAALFLVLLVLQFISFIEFPFRLFFKIFTFRLDIRASIKPSIGRAPGAGLLALVDFFFSPKTIEQTFKPLVADWRYEYFEALKQSRKWKARWISLRYRFSFINAMTLSKVLSLLKQIKSVIK